MGRKGIKMRRWLSAPARTSVNKDPERLSPWKEPTVDINSTETAELTRTFSFVFDNKNLTSRISSSEQPASARRFRMVPRLMVSKAALMSIPILWKLEGLFKTVATNIRWPHTRSLQLRHCL